MPIINRNFAVPEWQDNSAPPIDDSEMQAMSDTVEGNQIIVGSGAPTSATAGKVGQRYADISTTPATIYEVAEEWPFYGQPIPKMQTKEEIMEGGYLTGKGAAPYESWEIRAGSDNNHDITVAGLDTLDYLVITATCPTEGATIYCTYPNSQIVRSWSLDYFSEEYGLYYVNSGLSFATIPLYTYTIPKYKSLNKLLEAVANHATDWKQEADPNRNIAREYSTGGSYAAGDYCIHGGKLCRALEAVNGGAWDGTKWEEVRLADELRAHEEDHNNPHEVTAAQTGALSGSVIAAVQTTTTAARNYAAGDYFLYQGELYVVKEAVAQGGDLFGERTPEGVTILDMDTVYPASEYDADTISAQLVNTGLNMSLSRYRMGSGGSRIVTVDANYFYWADGNGTIRQVRYAENAEDVTDWQSNIPGTNYYYYYGERVSGGEAALIISPAAGTPTQTGGLYYRAVPVKDGGRYYQYVWPDDVLMFTGTEAQLQQFIAGIPNKKKSEPAVLGDGVTALYPKTGTISLSASWSGSGPYSQTVTVSGTTVTAKSMVDLLLTAAQLAQLAADEVNAVGIVNNNGALTAYALGAQPSVSMTVECRVKETV